MSSLNYYKQNTLAIALGSNIPSPAGPPVSTLITVKPQIEQLICEWIKALVPANKTFLPIISNLHWQWSPLYETQPIGGPSNQPNYINAVLVVRGEKFASIRPTEDRAIDLLKRFLELEKNFGRARELSKVKWGPRTLDIDLLAWGDLHINKKILVLPHPRFIERDFVLIPLAASIQREAYGIRQIPPQEGWEE
ncbi:2-amino-4-hydroxy-6-hydroxymethyldihydropteridine diphosphokinase [Prochlorococcus marinus]|uniref:2-amino-4-hydroxy-6-hydroxymethyldihydropteridine diphosphokinase n=1 Tax=Prochlorococcus marinus (strain MIT 9211) TaxID=93059 RepID=A9BDT4_PROM4|nr:2-amino-4-hydroxy-6-hydroxymethyldihydropteridine diphosphokinase [Prochlorococcus marinus]ABX08244.1 possible 2-amino-4-hydroxy-6-hydroxymethyldihydropteridine pyrophosphokinase [Prochlorococcus marinus str. MIT 9211]